MQRYLCDPQHHVIPIGIEDVPPNLACFDSVFSMGVLYHRRSPLDHLFELKGCLRPGGELILETLIVEGDRETIFMPQGRYAKMRNVWFLPSIAAMTLWLAALRVHGDCLRRHQPYQPRGTALDGVDAL